MAVISVFSAIHPKRKRCWSRNDRKSSLHTRHVRQDNLQLNKTDYGTGKDGIRYGIHERNWSLKSKNGCIFPSSTALRHATVLCYIHTTCPVICMNGTVGSYAGGWQDCNACIPRRTSILTFPIMTSVPVWVWVLDLIQPCQNCPRSRHKYPSRNGKKRNT